MVTYNWTSLNLQVKRQDSSLHNVIVAVLWGYSCSDAGYTVSETGRCILPLPDPLNYIPFDEITESILIGWLEANLDVELLNASMQSRLLAKIQQDTYMVAFPLHQMCSETVYDPAPPLPVIE